MSRKLVTSRLRGVAALKSGAEAMFEPMLERVAAERDHDSTPPQVAELLGRMHGAFGSHHLETRAHAERLQAHLHELGSPRPSRRIGAFRLGARAWVSASSLGGPNHGSNARNAFVFEHFEIASLELLHRLAAREGDRRTADLAAEVLVEDREMAATIGRNWENVLTLNIARSQS